MSSVLSTVGKVAGVASAIVSLVNPGIGAILAAVSPSADCSTSIHARQTMTAINVFDDHERAYLATDGASFSTTDGKISALGSKTVVLPSLKAAIAIQGPCSPALLQAAIEECLINTYDDLLTSLPQIIRIYDSFVEKRVGSPRAATRLWVASYDPKRCKPRLFNISTDTVPFIPNSTPYVLAEIGGNAVPGMDFTDVLPNGYIQHAKADICRILGEQRKFAFPALNGACGVGGRCELYTISKAGVVGEAILQFPEIVGEFANPALPGHIL